MPPIPLEALAGKVILLLHIPKPAGTAIIEKFRYDLGKEHCWSDDPVGSVRERLANIEGVEDQPTDPVFPRRVFGDVTNNCNLRGKFCTNPDWSIASPWRMSEAGFAKYTQLSGLLFPGSPLHLSLRMEPFLHAKLLNLIGSMTPEVRQQSMFTTNLCAGPLRGEIIEQLATSQLSFFNVSADTLDP